MCALSVLLTLALAPHAGARSVPGSATSADAEGRQAARRTVTLTTRLSRRDRSLPISRSFLGLSMEYKDALFKSGNLVTGVNPVTVGLLRNLTAARGAPPVLRIGGGSSDETWWNPERHTPRPLGINFDLGPGWTAGISELVGRTGSPLILGLDLAHEEPALAVEMARELTARLPRNSIKAFEVGNEPDIYPRRPFGRNPSTGRTVFARPRGYGVTQYLRELQRHVSALRRLRPTPPVAGPAASCDDAWCGAAERILKRFGRRLTALTYHSYPLHACDRRPGSRGYPTTRELLSGRAISRASAFRRVVAAAKRRRLPVRMTETNSVACGGAPGVSNTLASALWGLDWMFVLAAVGLEGVDFHSTSPLYAPYTTSYVDGQFFGAASPLYYGMLLFSHATANRARLVLGPTFATTANRRANMRVWSTRDRRGTERVIVLNKESRKSARVRIRVPGARRSGSLIRMRAPSVSSRDVTLAGQQVARPTQDGQLQGDFASARVRPRRGVYRFSQPPGSAALLTIERR